MLEIICCLTQYSHDTIATNSGGFYIHVKEEVLTYFAIVGRGRNADAQVL